jgi:molecular chaperone GrpE
MNEFTNEEGGTEIPITINVTDKRRVTVEGEVVADPDPKDPVEPVAPSRVEELEARLKESEEKLSEAERQVRDFADRFRSAQNQLRVEADEQRQRMQRNFDQRLESARADLVAGLLDTLDNLQRAITAAGKGERRDADFNALFEGVRATSQLFEAKMQALGLARIPSEGELFNPELHEAVEMVPVSAELDNRVIQEYQAGYRFGDRLLRPARVRVGRVG